MKITAPTPSDEVKEDINGKTNYKAPRTGHLQAEMFRYCGIEFKNKMKKIMTKV